jgi:hypothetical protein
MGTPGLRLGAPGVYVDPVVVEPAYQPVRLDVAGFVGVALRGPVDTCVLVTSWSDYERRFGGYERPGGGPDRMLPYALAAFFAQGGQRAYVVRVASPDASGAAAATARYTLGDLSLTAADEGSWGDRLAVELRFVAAQTFAATVRPREDGRGELAYPRGVTLVAGSLLRLRAPDTTALGVFRWVVSTGLDRLGQPVAVVDAPVGSADAAVTAALVTASLSIVDEDPADTSPDGASPPTDPQPLRHETIGDLGLHPDHPRFLGTTVNAESELIRVDPVPTAPIPPSGPLLLPLSARRTQQGADRWHEITGKSFFDDRPADADPLDEDPHRGADLAGRQPDIGLLCVPDLLWEWPLTVAPEPDAPPRPPPCFVPDRDEPPPPPYLPPPPAAARLDAADPGEFDEIVLRQQRLVDVALVHRRFVTLLDVPPNLGTDGVTRWRARFDTSFAAAYHPWLRVPRRPTPVAASADLTALPVPPSIFAAGIIAGRERRLGLPWGPANELATGAVGAAEEISDASHDRLHLAGVNVFRSGPDGFRLTAARTLSTDPAYQQLSVRRLMTMLALTLERQSQWLVFEPNPGALRQRLTQTVRDLLRSMFRGGAFAGDTEEDSFFVRCDDANNPRQSQEQGRLIAEVGVAPASPLEYLVLRISQDTDGRVQVEDGRG